LLTKLASEYELDHIPDIFALNELVASAARWTPSVKINGIRNEANAFKVMQHIRDEIIRLGKGHDRTETLRLFLGSDCSMAPSILSVLQQISTSKIGAIYFDGDCDLSLPGDSHDPGRSGILDSMVLSYYTQRAGCLDSIKAAVPKPDGTPLVDASSIVLFG
jgi:arginase